MIPLYIHLALLVLMCIFVIVAAMIARKRSEGWLLRHRMFGVLGAMSGIIGIGVMVTNKLIVGRPHFHSPHAIGGGIALLFLIITPLFGFLAFKGKDALRTPHRFMGRILVVLGILVLLSGIFQFLQILGVIKKPE